MPARKFGATMPPAVKSTPPVHAVYQCADGSGTVIVELLPLSGRWWVTHRRAYAVTSQSFTTYDEALRYAAPIVEHEHEG